MHRITDKRMDGSPRCHLRMFGELLGGDQPVKRVVLVTTMWDNVLASASEEWREIVIQREKELIENYWKTMMNFGASTARFSNSAASAWEILDVILKQQESEELLQEENVDLKKADETQAGATRSSLFNWKLNSNVFKRISKRH